MSAKMAIRNNIQEILIGNHKITNKEMNIMPVFNQNHEMIEDGIYVRVHLTMDKEVENLNKMRIFITEIQSMRKITNLHPWDPIILFYETHDISFKNIINQYNMVLNQKLGKQIFDHDFVMKTKIFLALI